MYRKENKNISVQAAFFVIQSFTSANDRIRTIFISNFSCCDIFASENTISGDEICCVKC